METITANQPQVSTRPVQVRCSSQPIGLCSSLRRIHFLKKEIQKIGVVKVLVNHKRCADGGCSCQMRLVRAPASRTATANTISETIATCAIAPSNPGTLSARRKYFSQAPDAFDKNPRPRASI